MIAGTSPTRNIIALFIGLCLVGPAAAADIPIPPINGPLVDNTNLLSVEEKANINASTAKFEALTGRQMVVMVFPSRRIPDLSSEERQKLDSAIGIIYITSPDDTTGRLLIVDPVWRKALPVQWSYMFPQRLAQKYGDEAFERRVVLSAQYLATVFTDKLAFVLKPRGGQLSPGSVQFARGAYMGIELLGYFIIFFTVFCTAGNNEHE